MTDFDLTPVSTEAPMEPVLRKGIGLCLSGGGYRAMLFHLGVVWRLAELGYLGTQHRWGKHGELGSLQRVSSVSGGSITAGVLGLAWHMLDVDAPGVSERFREHVAEPIQEFGSRSTVTILSALPAIVFSTVNKRVVRIYRKRLFGDATLQQLPTSPDFVFNTTNLQSGALWSFSKRAARDWRVGRIEEPTDTIARVVGASSAFPPFLSPARFRYRDEDFTPGSGDGLQGPPFTTRPLLTDGGVYDNLGLETVFKNYKTVICSDAGSDANLSRGQDRQQPGAEPAQTHIADLVRRARASRHVLEHAYRYSQVPGKGQAALPVQQDAAAGQHPDRSRGQGHDDTAAADQLGLCPLRRRYSQLGRRGPARAT
jgi:NTE family protein